MNLPAGTTTIVLGSARARLREALRLLDAIDGCPYDEADRRHVEVIDRLDDVPGSATPCDMIKRAADEARHAAQEALDEVAHVRGWP